MTLTVKFEENGGEYYGWLSLTNVRTWERVEEGENAHRQLRVNDMLLEIDERIFDMIEDDAESDVEGR